MKNKKEVRAGGKLYIVGEYSVLTPGQTAVIQFIPIYMQAEIQPAPMYRIQSDMFPYAVDLTPQADYALIQETVHLMNAYLQSQGVTPVPFDLRIWGKFEREGKKFGIGSSGSVVLLTLKAMAAFYDFPLSADLLFRLACLVLIRRGDNGSMGDLACIAYEGLVSYRSFDRRALAEQLQNQDLNQVLALDWGYEIRPLAPQLAYTFLVGWTQEPAISRDLINQVRSAIDPVFLEGTEQAVQDLLVAFQEADRDLAWSSIRRASDLLLSLSELIYTKKLAQLKRSEEGLEVIAKSSGAGGGDCGIALAFEEADAQEIVRRWQEAGIDLLYSERMGEYDDQPKG